MISSYSRDVQESFHCRNWYSTCVDWRESWLSTWVMIANVTHDCLHRAPQACRKNVGNNISFCGNVMTHDCRRESWLPTWLTLHSIAHLKYFLVKRSCAVSYLHHFTFRNSYGILLWKRLDWETSPQNISSNVLLFFEEDSILSPLS